MAGCTTKLDDRGTAQGKKQRIFQDYKHFHSFDGLLIGQQVAVATNFAVRQTRPILSTRILTFKAASASERQSRPARPPKRCCDQSLREHAGRTCYRRGRIPSRYRRALAAPAGKTRTLLTAEKPTADMRLRYDSRPAPSTHQGLMDLPYREGRAGLG